MKTRMFYFLSFFIAAIYSCTPGNNKISGIHFSSSTPPTAKETVFQLSNNDSPSYTETRAVNQSISTRLVPIKKQGAGNSWETMQKKYNVPMATFTISAHDFDTIIYQPSGTQLIIPAYAFEQSGKVLNDSVTIEYREFHNIKEIFFSGINMEYLVSTEKNIFESNGMYELRVSHHGQPAEIVDTRPLVINMSVNGDNTPYNFYTLNETTNTWTDNKDAIVDAKMVNHQEKIFTEQIVFEKPNLGIKILDKSVWNRLTWGKANDTYFNLVYNPKMYPDLDKFHDIVFQVHQTNKEFMTTLGTNYAEKKFNGNNPEYILCNEMLIKSMKNKSGYVTIQFQSTDFNATIEAIAYIPELKSEMDFFKTMISFESTQAYELFNRNSKREKKLVESYKQNYIPNKQAETIDLISNATGFSAPIYAKSPGIGNWDKPYPFLGPPAPGERQLIANIQFEDNHADVGKVFVADVTKNRLVPVSEKQEGKFRFNIDKNAEMMIWTVDEFGKAGLVMATEINLEDLNKRPLIELPVYTADELAKKLDLFGGKILDNKTEAATTVQQTGD